jgi:hypothetical protein
MEGVKINDLFKQIEDIENINLNLGKTIFRNHWKKNKEEVKFTIIPIDWKSIIKNQTVVQMSLCLQVMKLK